MERKKPVNNPDPRRPKAMIDNCALHYIGGKRGHSIKEIFKLNDKCPKENDYLDLSLPSSVRKEALALAAPSYVKRLAASMLYVIETPLSDTELNRRNEIRKIMQGDAAQGKHKDDADHLFECEKYGANYFITYDKRIKNLALKISNFLPKIVTPEELLEILHSPET